MPETGERQRLSSGDDSGKQRRSSSSGKREKQRRRLPFFLFQLRKIVHQ